MGSLCNRCLSTNTKYSFVNHTLFEDVSCVNLNIPGFCSFLGERSKHLKHHSILQALPDVPPAMADAVNRGSELIANLTVGTPWETVAKEVGNSFGVDSRIMRANVSKDIDHLVDVITSWMSSNTGPKLLRP